MSAVAADPPLWLQNEEYPARLDRQLIAACLPEGIIRGLNVSPHTPAPDYTVNVSDGMACITGDDEDDQGAYLAVLSDPVDVAIAPPGGQNRIDLIVLRVNDSQAGGPTGDNATVSVLQGVPTAGTPAAPVLPKTAISLASVTVAPSTTAITAAQISGLSRAFSRGVGIVELYGGSVEPPWGLFCDGRAVSRTVYRDLFSVCGVLWGSGNGSTTFNLPNFKGRTPFGVDGADTLFNTVGKTGGSKNTVVVAHSHTINHDHPLANTSQAQASVGKTATEAKVVQESSFGGGHQHGYSRMVEDNVFAAGTARSGGVSLSTVDTGQAGGHSHNTTIPAHNHTFNVPVFNGSTAQSGQAGTNMNLPPFGVVNLVIRT